MQNNQDKNWNNEEKEHWKDILSRQWKKDFASMTQDEIHLNLQNIFWQIFMIQLESIKIISHADTDGHPVSFTITGEVYRDGDDLPNHLMLPELEDEEFED